MTYHVYPWGHDLGKMYQASPLFLCGNLGTRLSIFWCWLGSWMLHAYLTYLYARYATAVAVCCVCKRNHFFIAFGLNLFVARPNVIKKWVLLQLKLYLSSLFLFIIELYITLPWLYLILFDSTLLYNGSTSLYLIQHYSSSLLILSIQILRPSLVN